MVQKPILITVGVINKPHNLNGALKIFPITDYPERFLDRKEILVETKETIELMQIENVTLHSGYLIMNLVGIDCIEKAEKLKGAYLKISEAQLEPLEEDTYYIYQLIGLEVKDINGKHIGRLEEVLKTGANDVYLIRAEDNKEILIPALKKVVKKIDINSNEIIVDLLQ